MDLRYNITADDGPMRQALGRVQASLRTTHESFTGMTSRLEGAFGRLNGLMAGFAAALAGGAAMTKAISDTAAMTEGAMDLGRALGVNTNTAQQFSIALQDIGSSNEELTGAAKGLARQLRENEAGLNKMGLVTRTAAGEFRPRPRWSSRRAPRHTGHGRPRPHGTRRRWPPGAPAAPRGRNA